MKPIKPIRTGQLNQWIGLPYLLGYLNRRLSNLETKINHSQNELERGEYLAIKMELMRMKIFVLKYRNRKL